MKIRVLVDGVEISIPVLNDVKVIVDFDEEEDDTFDSLHHTFTHEGRIIDLVEAGNVPATDCQMYEEIVETLTGEE